MGGDDRRGVGIGSGLVGAVIVRRVGAIGHRIAAHVGPGLALALGSRHAGGDGVHGHVQHGAGFVLEQVVVDGVLGHPLAGGIADVVGIDAEPGSDLVAVAVDQAVVAGHDQGAGLGALLNDRLGHGLIRNADEDGVRVVGDGGVYGGQALFGVAVGAEVVPLVGEAVLLRPGGDGRLDGSSFIDEVHGLGLVQTVEVPFGLGFLCQGGEAGQQTEREDESKDFLHGNSLRFYFFQAGCTDQENRVFSKPTCASWCRQAGASRGCAGGRRRWPAMQRAAGRGQHTASRRTPGPCSGRS